MAHSSAKSRLFSSLNRSRTSSPNVDEYATAGSFDLNNDQILNSTVNMPDDSRQGLPLNYDEHPSFVAASEDGSEGSADMSIELGRGAKRGAREQDADISSNIVLNFGGDSQYELTGTPPVRPRNSSRKSDGLLREASTRKANDALKRNASNNNKQRSLSEALANMTQESEVSMAVDNFQQATATFTTRNTRFMRSRQVSTNEQVAPPPTRFSSAQDGTPRRQAVNNPTVQSATYTANSFMLPDLPNITELVSGVRKDGTPVFNHASNKPRSRFTSAGNYKQLQPQHMPLESLPIPEEEKAIFASLQLLQQKVTELETTRSEAQKRAEEYEGEIIDLRSQLDAERRRPDSALGSDVDDDAQSKARMEKTRLQASLKAAQDRLDRAERKISISEITVQRITKERDELVTQIGSAYFNSEEMKRENETFRESYSELQGEFDEMQDEMEELRKENSELRMLLAQGQAWGDEGTSSKERRARTSSKNRVETRKESSRGGRDITREGLESKDRSPERQEPALRSRKEAKATSVKELNPRRQSFTATGPMQEDIATRIAREVQRHRAEAMATKAMEGSERDAKRARDSSSRSRSKAQRRQAATGVEHGMPTSKRAVSAPTMGEMSEPESTGEEMTQKTRETLRKMHLPSPAKQKLRAEDTRDLTLLSYQSPEDVADLRRKIEEEHMARRVKRNASAPETQREETVRSNGNGFLPRKSSLKDLTAGVDNGTGRFSLAGEGNFDFAKAAKTVRVQSPHTSDGSALAQQHDEAGDETILSNTSRRRHRRAMSEEGMTSAFILPDITLHISQPMPSTIGSGKICIQHNAISCTACHPGDVSVTIPTPVPVTDREAVEDPDITTATIRPAQAPPLALATVIKNLEDEIVHLKLQLEAQQRCYHQHTPALSKRQRLATNSKIRRLTAEVEKRSDQVYALYDVLEGQKQAAVFATLHGAEAEKAMIAEEVEETLMSIGLDPAELSGRVGRAAPFGLNGAGDVISESESEELPWEGLSDYESEEEVDMRQQGVVEKRRSAVF
ncbi:hypothetical protein LTR86_000138 [Recurvomyces mirabilis]|nr:hypothetical protein LTR86_000138 [Recurvomyces mirabilis]